MLFFRCVICNKAPCAINKLIWNIENEISKCMVWNVKYFLATDRLACDLLVFVYTGRGHTVSVYTVYGALLFTQDQCYETRVFEPIDSIANRSVVTLLSLRECDDPLCTIIIPHLLVNLLVNLIQTLHDY